MLTPFRTLTHRLTPASSQPVTTFTTPRETADGHGVMGARVDYREEPRAISIGSPHARHSGDTSTTMAVGGKPHTTLTVTASGEDRDPVRGGRARLFISLIA